MGLVRGVEFILARRGTSNGDLNNIALFSRVAMQGRLRVGVLVYCLIIFVGQGVQGWSSLCLVVDLVGHLFLVFQIIGGRRLLGAGLLIGLLLGWAVGRCLLPEL